MKKNIVLIGLLLIVLLGSYNVFGFDKSKTKIETNQITDKKIEKKNVVFKVPVLMFHSINNDENRYNSSFSTMHLEELLKKLKSNKFKSISLNDLSLGNIDKKSILLTFDDGYEDFYSKAVPLLDKYGYKAVNGVIVNKIGTNDYMNKKEIIELSNKGYEIVTHTLNHKELNSLDYINQKKEIKDSRNQLEKITGKKINAIIYPAGKYNKTTLKILKELNFDFGFTTKNGKFKNGDNKFEIKRMRIDNRNNIDNLLINLLY